MFEGPKSNMLAVIVAVSFLSTVMPLSPLEFQNFYEPQNTHTYQTVGSRFPMPYFVRPPVDSSLSFNGPTYFVPHREPQTTRSPFNKHKNFLSQQQPIKSKFPYRPVRPSNYGQNSALQNEMNLVKLRKMYSNIKDTSKSPTSNTNKFKIPPEYIRDNYGLNHNYFQEQNFHRPFWRPFTSRKGRKSQNKVHRYMGPNNKSVIFETRLHAAVNIEEEKNKYPSDYMKPLDFENELDDIHFSSRPKRFLINEKFLKTFYSQSYVKRCKTTKGYYGKCMNFLHCYKTQGTPEYSKHCGFEACCVYSTKSCGLTTIRNETIWETPENNSYGDSCKLGVVKLFPGICQIRLDLQEFKLKGPTNGTCLEDKLVITGQNINSVVPRICGVATGEHMYVDVDSATGHVELNIVSVGEFDRKWKIKVSQIECDAQYRPPNNCLQYYTNTTGTFGSFNRNNTARQYLNNLNYAVCLRKGVGYCSIQYEISQAEIFNFTNTDNDSMPTVTAGNAGVGPVDCPDDYIVIAGNRLCGGRFNDGSNPSMSENTKVIDPTNGPFIIQVKSNELGVSDGFELNYHQIPC